MRADEQSGNVLTARVGFAVCISKLSDIYGRRNMLVLSWIIFMAFSMGCATSRDMVALYACSHIAIRLHTHTDVRQHYLSCAPRHRSSGLYSLTQIGLVEIGPVHRPSLIGAMIGATLAVAFVLGPLLGGVIAQLSDWRWLFHMK